MAALTVGQLTKRQGRVAQLVKLFANNHKFAMHQSSKVFSMTCIVIDMPKGVEDIYIKQKDVKTESAIKKAATTIRTATAKKGKLRYLGYIGTNKKEESIAAGKLSKNNVTGGEKSGGGTESLGVRAETLILKGKLEKIDFAGQKVECRTFTSVDKMKESIIYGLKKNPKIPPYIVETFEQYLCKSCVGGFDKIRWSSAMPDNELNQLGKYAGEVITGLIAMGGPRTSYLPNIIKTDKVAKFCVPTDPAFTGIDVVLLMKDGTIYPISNKYGAGAAASFFANVLPKCMEYYRSLDKSPIKDFAKYALARCSPEAMSRRGAPAKQVLYDYGIREVLGLGKNLVPETYEVYRSIKSGKYSPEAHIVMEAIKEYKGVSPKVTELLPKSTTAFFSRTVADLLNKDKKSQDEMKRVLAGKNYWQANLIIAEWEGGRVKYKFLNSGNIKLKLIGSKSAIGDIDASQGMLNYIMQ